MIDGFNIEVIIEGVNAELANGATTQRRNDDATTTQRRRNDDATTALQAASRKQVARKLWGRACWCLVLLATGSETAGIASSLKIHRRLRFFTDCALHAHQGMWNWSWSAQ